MSIKPIPLKTWEVQAILDNRKSTMRRVVTPHNARKAKLCEYAQGNGLWVKDGYIKDYSVSSCWMKVEGYISKYFIYKPGDVLWVRETWQQSEGGTYFYKANGVGIRGKWNPSIHMPREAARLFLRVESVRVERLQEITVDGIKQEGVALTFPLKKLIESEHLKRFVRLWNSTIRPADRPRYGWDANPWVWVIEFEQCEKPEGWA